MSALPTPAPWRVVSYGDGNDLVIHDARGDWRVCFMATPGDSGDMSAIRANARLIAAAPELLELAYQYLSDLRHPPTGDSRERRIERAEKVIAKATGAA